MLSFGSAVAGPSFVPNDEGRDWIAEGIVDLAPKLGEAATKPRLLTDPATFGFGGPSSPKDLDGLFDMICTIQEFVGQRDVELTMMELDERAPAPDLSANFQSMGDSKGKLLHTLRGDGEYLVIFTPTVFKVRELMLAGIARELGRVALDQVGLGPDPEGGHEALREWEADSELAGIMLGMGIWVANGAYLFENACCGGGCGVDLRSVQTGLTMPEACYALALDSQRKGIRRRHVVKHLAPTQKAAAKKSWSHVGSAPPPALAAAPPTIRGQLSP